MTGQPKNLQLGMESVIRNTEYLLGEKYAGLQCIYSGFFSRIPLFLVCLLNFHLLRCFFFCLFCSRPLCSMSSPSLGCAWNADGSLKPTEEIEWSYSWTPYLFWCSHPRSKTHRSRTEAEPEVSLSTGLQAVLNLDVLISQNYLGRFDSSCLDLQKPRQTLC